nr:MAG TPA: hypothetical protein [Caudoviricetes sp.]DAH76202.1 MAG TPA: hypothetical protein [Caudoviricetes sp.]
MMNSGMNLHLTHLNLTKRLQQRWMRKTDGVLS